MLLWEYYCAACLVPVCHSQVEERVHSAGTIEWSEGRGVHGLGGRDVQLTKQHTHGMAGC